MLTFTMVLRITIFVIFVSGILASIAFIFWRHEYQFNLPTPKPKNVKLVEKGDLVSLDFIDNKRASYIHFYNYDCPCSRFNIKEFQSLVHEYKGEVDFYAIIESEGLSQDDIKDFQTKYDLGIPVIQDKNGKIASQLGIYSTPQVVILNSDTVYYKGNYNKARFCLTKNTKFAEIALHSLVNKQPLPVFPAVAAIPYGCSLPSNGKQNTLLSKWKF